MTNRMAIVPVEASETMIKSGAHTNSEWLNDNAPIGEKRYEAPAQSVFGTMLAASPHAGKVSRDQHRDAMVALQNSKWPFMPADQRSEIIDIVIAAFGLEKAE